MKRSIRLISFLLCLTELAIAQSNNFWTRVPGPYGGAFRNITVTNSGILYVQPDQSFAKNAPFGSRLYRSADGAQQWSILDLNRNGQFLNSYIDVGRSGTFNTLVLDSTLTKNALYRSFDEGNSWTLIKDSLPFRAVFETPGGALLARTATNKDIWRSSDGGQSWTLMFNTTSAVTGDLQVLQNGDLAFAGATFETYRSWDDGQSWQIIGQTTAQQYRLTITQAGTLLVPKGSNIYRSTNNGQTWQITILSGFQLESITVLANGQLLGCDPLTYKLYLSANDGQNWSNLPTNRAISKVLPMRLADGTIFATCNESLYRSTNEGLSWQFAAQGMTLAQVLQMAFISNDTVFAMTRNGLWRTTNEGQQWTQLTDNKKYFSGIFQNSRSFTLGDGHFLAAFVDDSLYGSADLGEHFTPITPPGGIFQAAIEISPGDSFLYANAKSPLSVVMRSADKGLSWQPLFNESSVFRHMAFHPSGRVYATLSIGNSPYNFWYSDNIGLNWTPVTGIPVGLEAMDLHIDPAGNIYLSGEQSAQNYPLYRSIDNGQSWQKRNATDLVFYDLAIEHNAASHLFLLPPGGIMARSLDLGVTWSPMPALPPKGTGSYMTIDDPISPSQHLYISHDKNGLFRTSVPTTQGAYLSGSLRKDADNDCSTPDSQAAIANWAIEATGNSAYFAKTDSAGHYLIFVDTGTYDVRVQVPNDNWWATCDSIQTIPVQDLLGVYTANFSAAALVNCPLVTVDLSVPRMRRCFNNSLYVNYCNEGTEPANDAWVDVSLDPFTTFISSTIPATPLGNGNYRFEVGDLALGACGQFTIVVYVNCDSTVLGQTHCFLAHSYPDTLCAPVEGWSGAQINANIDCLDTLLRFKLRNTGPAASQLLQYGIIVDDVVLMTGQKQYNPDEVLTLEQPAAGQTWRIESQQEPGHPFSNVALAFSEGCGGFNSLGFINRFPVDESRPSWDRECVPNLASYDPNDKQGFPLGTHDQHLIRPGQELEYQIRFQNTGTDTAFTVVVRDTLSPWLDPASVRPGASSHPYTWTLSGNGVLSFTFNNIQLPDSNVNEATSHGFISFRIAQQADVPLDAVIYNEANIYFDFNAPVVTNKTWHTVGVPVTVGLLPTPENPLPSDILVTPQPATDFAVFQQRNGQPFRNHRLYLSDALGHVVRAAALNGGQCRIEREELAEGLYFFRIEQADGRPVGSGRLVWQR